MIGALLIRFGASRADLKAEADLGVQAMAEIQSFQRPGLSSELNESLAEFRFPSAVAIAADQTNHPDAVFKDAKG